MPNRIKNVLAGAALASLAMMAAPLALAQTTVNVSNASQLQSELSAANGAGGNRIISLADGTYQLSDTLYVNAANITIKSQSGKRQNVIIQGDSMSQNATVKNLIRVAASNFTAQDITLQRAGWHLVQIAGEAGGTSPTMRNVIFRDAYQQMVKVSTDNPASPSRFVDNGIVENSLFEYSAGKGPQWYIGGIDAHAARKWTVRGNTFRNIASPGGGVAEYAVHFWSASADNVVERNSIINCDRGIGFGMEGRPASGGIIRNNMIYHANNGAPHADVAISLTESRNSSIYNNTVILENNFPWAIEYRYSNTSNATIVNNLTNKPVQQRDGASGTVGNNVGNASASWFVNGGSGDLHLASKVSSVVDAGRAVSGLTNDFDSQTRSGGIDVGADEYGATVVPMPPTDLQVQ